MIGPILKGKKIILKPIEVSKARIYLDWIQDPTINKFLHNDGKGFDLKKEKEWVKKVRQGKDEFTWSIYTKSGQLIGNTSLRINKKNKKADFGIVIGEKDEWSKGYGADTLKIVLRFAFNKLKLNRVELSVFKENISGKKCYTRCGFKKEGIKRQSVVVEGKFMDEIIMGLLRDDYKNIK